MSYSDLQTAIDENISICMRDIFDVNRKGVYKTLCSTPSFLSTISFEADPVKAALSDTFF